MTRARILASLSFAAAILLAAVAACGAGGETSVSREIEVSKRELLSASIQSFESDADSSSQLAELVKTLGALRVLSLGEMRPTTAKPTVPRRAPGTPETRPALAAQSAESQPATRPARAPISLDPGTVDDPITLVMLADSLYRAGRYEEALGFYQRITELDATDDLTLWARLQKAACMEKTDVAQAADAYHEVVREGNDMVWGEIADIRERIARWRAREPIEEILEVPGE